MRVLGDVTIKECSMPNRQKMESINISFLFQVHWCLKLSDVTQLIRFGNKSFMSISAKISCGFISVTRSTKCLFEIFQIRNAVGAIAYECEVLAVIHVLQYDGENTTTVTRRYDNKNTMMRKWLFDIIQRFHYCTFSLRNIA